MGIAGVGAMTASKQNIGESHFVLSHYKDILELQQISCKGMTKIFVPVVWICEAASYPDTRI
jgi:hypothetical protein